MNYSIFRGAHHAEPQQQRFLPVHGQVRNFFGAHRDKIAASGQCKHLIFAWDQWQEIVTQARCA